MDAKYDTTVLLSHFCHIHLVNTFQQDNDVTKELYVNKPYDCVNKENRMIPSLFLNIVVI